MSPSCKAVPKLGPYHTISDDTRQAFLKRTGLVWNHPDVKWPERGTEVLAKTIAWGLLSEQKPMTSPIGPSSSSS